MVGVRVLLRVASEVVGRVRPASIRFHHDLVGETVGQIGEEFEIVEIPEPVAVPDTVPQQERQREEVPA